VEVHGLELTSTETSGAFENMSKEIVGTRRGGTRSVQNARHVTGLYGTSAAGENVPPLYFFDSAVKDPEKRKFDVRWLIGLPRTRAQFGHKDVRIFEPVIAVTPKGGMCDDYLDQWAELCIYPLFPDISKEQTAASSRLLTWRLGGCTTSTARW
jgi:hypothetical protein